MPGKVLQQQDGDRAAAVSFLPHQQTASVENLKPGVSGNRQDVCLKCLAVLLILSSVGFIGLYFWYMSLASHGQVSIGEPEWDISDQDTPPATGLSGE